MEKKKQEVFLRITAAALLVLTALLVRFDTQTKLLYYIIVKKATYKALCSLLDLVWIALAVASYSVIHVLRIFFFPIKEDFGTFYRSLAWVFYLVDQGVVYLVFATTCSVTGAGVIAITGEDSLLWTKLCDKFTKFCFQLGGALLCGLVASFMLAVISSLSAYRVFRLYSPKQFLWLKNK